jgi:CheY-like chemotaxis protein
MTRSDPAPILVVEDDRDAREMLEQLLTANGYEVHTSTNGQEALEQLETISQPCLIVLDLMMPVMDGWQFLSHLKRTRRATETAVIILSAVADRNRHEGYPVVHKPADISRLLRLVAEYCPTRVAGEA